MLEEILAYGHPNVRATHKTTMQVTKDEEISRRADCVIGVRANKSVADLSEALRVHLIEGGDVLIVISVFDQEFKLYAQGSKDLRLSHPKDSVIRKSDYVDERTLVIRATASSRDLPRGMVKRLRDPRAQLCLTISF
ncbi:MAG: DUF371 domain-containing protein [Candidatus Korarchaeum sp.]|nr:DUF371 domain-containing protein [Candidatus Korarchaeum sp.]MDW8035332.1 DUF371 domain-containing protein [Candidatus Korarchaeum sp.]